MEIWHFGMYIKHIRSAFWIIVSEEMRYVDQSVIVRSFHMNDKNELPNIIRETHTHQAREKEKIV